MAKKGWVLRASLAAAAALLIALFCRVTVVPDAAPSGAADAGGNGAAEAALSAPERYARDNWDGKMLPAIDGRAIDPAAFRQGMKADLAALGEKHAARANETSPWSFCLKGRVKVLGVLDADKKTKTRLLMDVVPYDGEGDLSVQISTVIKTNAIRDAVGFLKLDDFENQVEFAELTKAFNARVQRDVLAGLDAQALVGKEVELTGCVSVSSPGDEALVVPVRIAEAGA